MGHEGRVLVADHVRLAELEGEVAHRVEVVNHLPDDVAAFLVSEAGLLRIVVEVDADGDMQILALPLGGVGVVVILGTLVVHVQDDLVEVLEERVVLILVLDITPYTTRRQSVPTQ